MKPTNINIDLIETYLGMLRSLNSDSKLELISKLSKSMKSEKVKKGNSLNSLYGAFISNKTADELLADIKGSRTFNRKRAEF